MSLHSSSINYGGNASFGGTTINISYFPVTSSINSTNGFVSVQSTLFIGGNIYSFQAVTQLYLINRGHVMLI